MEWWVSLLTGGAGVLISLIITFIFNGIINLPKRKRQKEQEEEHKAKEFLDRVDSTLNNSNKNIYDELRALRLRDEEFDKDLKSLKKGLQVNLKNDLKIRYESWIAKGYAPIDAKDDLEKMYQAYHNLGANGVMDSLRDEFMALPLEYIVRKRAKSKINSVDDVNTSDTEENKE